MNARDPQAIQALFNEVSPTYDRLNRILSLGLDRRWREAAVEQIGAVRGGDVFVDVCGGTGDLAVALAMRSSLARVVLVDFAEDMLRLAQRKLPVVVTRVDENGSRSHVAPVHPVCADALVLPLRDQSCAAVTAGFGIRNLKDTRAGLVEAHRVLRPGGRIVILEFMRPQGLFAPLKRFALRHLVPLTVALTAREHAPAYRYLTESIVNYLTLDKFTGMLREIGFEDITVRHQPLGFASVIGGTRR